MTMHCHLHQTDAVGFRWEIASLFGTTKPSTPTEIMIDRGIIRGSVLPDAGWNEHSEIRRFHWEFRSTLEAMSYHCAISA